MDKAFNFTVRMQSQPKQDQEDQLISKLGSQGTAEFKFIQNPEQSISQNSHILAVNDFLPPPTSPNSSDSSCLHIPTSLKFTSSNSTCVKSNVKLRYQNQDQEKEQQQRMTNDYQYQRKPTIDSLTVSQQTQKVKPLNEYFPSFKSFQTSAKSKINNIVMQDQASNKSSEITPTSSHIKRKAAGFLCEIQGEDSLKGNQQYISNQKSEQKSNIKKLLANKDYIQTPQSSFVISQIESECTQKQKYKKKNKSFLQNVKLIQKAVRQWLQIKKINELQKIPISAASSASRYSSLRNNKIIKIKNNTNTIGSRNSGYQIINIKSSSSLVDEDINSAGSPVFLKIQSSKNTNRNYNQEQIEQAAQKVNNRNTNSASSSSSSALLTTHLMNSINCVRKFRQKLKQDSENLRMENEQILSFNPLKNQSSSSLKQQNIILDRQQSLRSILSVARQDQSISNCNQTDIKEQISSLSSQATDIDMKVAKILSSPLGSIILSDVSVFRETDEKNNQQGQEAPYNYSHNKDNLISIINNNNSFNINSLLAPAPRSSCFSKTAESLLQYSPESVGMRNTAAIQKD